MRGVAEQDLSSSATDKVGFNRSATLTALHELQYD